MKAFVISAEWSPKSEYKVSEWEKKERIAYRANMVFRNPTWGVQDYPDPKIGPDEVLVKVKACGVCGSDVHMLRKEKNSDYIYFGGWGGFPCVIGHEWAGVVTEVGKNVTTIVAGDLVTAEEVQWCGQCDVCRAGWLNLCKNVTQLGFETRNPGAMAEYIKVKEKYVWKLNALKETYSNDNDILEAGSLVEPTSVAYEGIFTVAGGLRLPGGHAAVFGTGPIGLASIQLLKTGGAAKIIAFEPMKFRAELAKKMGADYVFDPMQVDPVQTMKELTGGQGCAMLVEAAGLPSVTIPIMVQSVAPAGKIVQIGMGADRPSLDALALQYAESSIYGSMGHSGHGDFGNVISLMGARRINVLPMITARYPLKDTATGIENADKGNAKVTIKL